MKISLFFDRFRPFHLTKEVGQIVLGLRDIRISSEVITYPKAELEGFLQVPLFFTSDAETNSAEFWRNYDADAVIFITWFHSNYIRKLERARDSGKRVVLKADSDGRITFPVPPRIWTTLSPYPRAKKFKNVARFVKGLLTVFSKIYSVLRHFEVADLVVFETPSASENAKRILRFWGAGRFAEKVRTVPSPISDDVLALKPARRRDKRVVAVANWLAEEQKNTPQMVRTLVEFVRRKPDWQVTVAGDMKSGFAKALREAGVEVTGKVPHKKALELMSVAMINFVPSVWESFCLSAAESLCLGCSVVGTPIEVFDFFAKPGPVVVSRGFTARELLHALEEAVRMWEGGDVKTYPAHWRRILDRRRVAGEFLRMAKEALK